MRIKPAPLTALTLAQINQTPADELRRQYIQLLGAFNALTAAVASTSIRATGNHRAAQNDEPEPGSSPAALAAAIAFASDWPDLNLN